MKLDQISSKETIKSTGKMALLFTIALFISGCFSLNNNTIEESTNKVMTAEEYRAIADEKKKNINVLHLQGRVYESQAKKNIFDAEVNCNETNLLYAKAGEDPSKFLNCDRIGEYEVFKKQD